MSANVVTTSSPPETSARFVVPDRMASEARGVDPSWARKAYERGELPYPIVDSPVPPEEKAFVVALYRSGLSVNRISDYVRRSRKAVRNWVKAAGIDTTEVGHARTKQLRTGDRDQRVYELRILQGWKWAAICNVVGVPEWNRANLQMAMRRYAQRNGLTMERSA